MSESFSASEVRSALVTRQEVALIDVRDEAVFALGHPLFAAQVPLARLEHEAPVRIPRRQALVVLYGDGDQAERGARQLRALDYSRVKVLNRGLDGWRAAGFELFQDVNSYSKAFGELVEARRHTPSLTAREVASLIEQDADIAVVDARRFDEYHTMSIPTGTSVPGAELVLRAPAVAPDPSTTIVVNCAGRTRSIIGTQSLINAGLPNRVVALRNGTMGWKLAGYPLDSGQTRRAPLVSPKLAQEARSRARQVAYRAGVRHIGLSELAALAADAERTLYSFDVRAPEEYAAGHLTGFRNAPGGQLVQEIDFFAPVRGARIVLTDEGSARADMTASWLAQMAWDVYVLDAKLDDRVAGHEPRALTARDADGRYVRPYEGTEASPASMNAYLEWEFGLVAQLERDGSHGFFVI